MRVAINGWFWQRPETGSGQYVRNLVPALVRLDTPVEPVILLPTHRGDAGRAPPGVEFACTPLPPGNLSKVWWEQVLVPRLALRANVDLLHVPYWAPPFPTPLPTVVTVHDLIPLLLRPYRGDSRARLYTSLVRATSQRATLLLTDSDAAREDILRHLKVPAERVRAIPLATDSVYSPTPAPKDRVLLQELGLEPGYVLYLGSCDVRKNLRTLCDAFAIVSRVLPPESGTPARLVLAGKLPAQDSAFTPDPRRLCREAGVPAECVSFPGLIAEEAKPALYRGARVFAFPSRYEGFGLPPLEALACGVPVVGSNASSLPEVVGAAGVLVAPDDAEGMAGALLHLLGDDTFHRELQQQAREQAARFSWERTARQTAAAYQIARG